MGKNKVYEDIVSEDIADEIRKENEEIIKEAVEEAVEETAEEVIEEAPLSKEEEDYKTRFIRLSADFANYKKRVEKEKADIYKFANEKLIVDLLAVVDNFERAMDHSTADASDTSIMDGVTLIKKTLDDVLEKNGLEYIDALGQPFDHNLHHAVMSEESDDHDSEVVSAEFQKGYKLNSRVIRPSMVKVSK